MALFNPVSGKQQITDLGSGLIGAGRKAGTPRKRGTPTLANALPPSFLATAAPGSTPTTIEEEVRSGTLPPAPPPPPPDAVKNAVKTLAPGAAPPTTGAAPAGGASTSVDTGGFSGFTLTDDQRKGLVDQVFGSGVAQGDPSYWYNTPPEGDTDLISAIGRGLGNPNQRKAIVDYLFDSGLASGDRNYWYNTPPEGDRDLLNTFLSSGDGTQGSTGTASKTPEQLRQEALDAALASIAASFGGDISQQEALLASLAPELARLVAINKRDQGFAEEQSDDSSIERGLFDSGLRIENRVRAAQPFVDAIGEATGRLGDTGSQAQQIRAAIAALRGQQGAAETSAKIASERDQQDFLLQLAQYGL